MNHGRHGSIWIGNERTTDHGAGRSSSPSPRGSGETVPGGRVRGRPLGERLATPGREQGNLDQLSS
jgi:hypothetical protein